MLNNNLKLLRGIRQLNQQDVANEVGITCSYYGMIEKGIRTPNLNIAYRLAKFFDTTIEQIFFFD